MPSLGADMEAGTLVEWKVKPGDRVKRGDIIAVVETQKGAVEVDFWESGILEEIVVPLWQKVPVGTVLARLREDGVAQAATQAAPKPARPSPPPVLASEPPPLPAAETSRLRASPSARRLARELGVDLATVVGTGSGGAITHDDVAKAAEARKAAPARPAATERAGAMRQAIAAAMARSKREIPHYYLSTTVDLTKALAWLGTENAKRSVAERLLPVVLLLKATALALREVPELNGFWVDGALRPSQAIHMGFGISLREGGLVSPALHDADRKPLGDLMRDLSDLIRRARAGGLRSSELSEGTITVTNLGDRGVDTVFGIIYPPQVALVGFGKIAERPWAANGMVGARSTVIATLAGDHRASDGHRGGVFLAAIDRLLQEPEKL